MEVIIEQLAPSDWEPVRSIYLEGIATGDATFETEAPSWDAWNKAHLSFGRLVARSVNSVLGWAALGPVSSRRVYAGVAEVSVYVAVSARGKGIGRMLLERLITEAEGNGVWTLQASSPKTQRASLCTKAAGFAR